MAWLVLHRVEVRRYLEKKGTTWVPDGCWWVFVGGLYASTLEANVVFIQLQGLTTLFLEQRVRLKYLATTYCRISREERPVDEHRIHKAYRSTNSIGRSFNMSHSHAQSCLDGLSCWVLQALADMGDDFQALLARSIADVLVHLANGISNIVSERDSSDVAGDELSPVLPHQLVRSDMRTQVSNIEVHAQRLLRRYSPGQVREIDEEFAALGRTYRIKPTPKTALDAKAGKVESFEQAWAPVAGRLEMLKEFCGGIATVFSKSTAVEADVSRLGLEKNDYRQALTDLSLTGVLYSKQFSDLVALYLLVLIALRMLTIAHCIHK